MNNVIKYFSCSTDEWVRALVDINYNIEKAFEDHVLTIVSKSLYETWRGIQEFHKIYCFIRDKNMHHTDFVIVLYGSKVLGVFNNDDLKVRSTFYGLSDPTSPAEKLSQAIVQSTLMKYVFDDTRWNRFKLNVNLLEGDAK